MYKIKQVGSNRPKKSNKKKNKYKKYGKYSKKRVRCSVKNNKIDFIID